MSESKEQLDWLAFQYVADELSDAEAAEFEMRLEDDQPAREAVARAVHLTEATYLASESTALTTAATGKKNWQRAVLSMVVGAAACFAAVAIYQSWMGEDQSGIPRTAAASGVSAELAIAWTQTVDEEDAPSEEQELLNEIRSQLDEDQEQAPLAPAIEQEEAENAPPSWMLAALRGLKDKDDPTDHDAGQVKP